MAEKILNTRISLRYDSYENWITNDPVLRQGELALAGVSVKQDGVVNEVPSVLIKCGDGTHKYSELDYVFAKAADVIEQAKSAEKLTTFINNVIKNSGLATDTAMTALGNRVTTAEGKITTAEGKIAALEGLVGETGVAEQINNAIAALKLSETYAAKSHTHTKSEITDFAHTHEIDDVTGLQAAIDDAKKAGTDADTALKAYKVTNDAAVQANADAISAINNETTGILAKAKTYADTKDATITAAKNAADAAQADIDALEAKVGTVPDDKTVVQMIADAQKAATYDDTAIKADIKANTDDITALKGLVGETEVSAQIQTAITNLDLPNTYEAKGAAATVKTDLVGKDADTDASATIAGAKKYADKLDAAMDTRVDALEAAIGAGGSVGTQIDTKIQALDATVETATIPEGQDGIYVKVTEADGKLTAVEATIEVSNEINAAKSELEGKIGTVAEGKTLAGLIADNAAAIQAHKDAVDAKVATLIGADADKSVRTIANEELAAQLIPENAKESLNTLQEIAAWIQAHPDDASKMAADIADLKTQVGDDPVSDQINAAITALKIGDYAKAADLTAAVARVTTAEGKISTLETNVATNTADIATLKGTGEGSVAKTVSDAVAALDVEDAAVAHQFVTAVSEEDGKIAVTRAAITTDDIAQGVDVLILDCGSSAV